MGFSKQKDRVLLALSEGAKLHEFMRERDAPSKSMLEEWRDNDPEFEVAYQQAVEAGRMKRGEPAAAPAKPKPAPTVTDEDGREHVIPRSTALLREGCAPQPLARPHSGIEPDEADPRVFREEPMSTPAPAPAEPLHPQPAEAIPKSVSHQAANLAKARAAKAALRAGGAVPAPAAVEAPTPVEPAPVAAAIDWSREYETLAKDFEQFRNDSNLQVLGLREELAKAAHSIGQLTEETHRWSEAEKRTKEVHQREINRLTTQLEKPTDEDGNFTGREVAWNAVCEIRAGILTDDGALAAKMLEVAMTTLYHPSFRQRDELTPAARKALGAALGLSDEPEKLPTPAPTHPGLLLADLLRRAGTPRADFAAALGIGLSTLNTLLAGNTCLSMAVCAKLEKLHWGTAEAWCRRQIDFDNHREAQPVAA